MSQYAKLDELILKTLAYGPWSFVELQSGVLWAECVRLASATGQEDFRILDRRIQALRHARKIRFTGRKVGQGWELVKGDPQ